MRVLNRRVPLWGLVAALVAGMVATSIGTALGGGGGNDLKRAGAAGVGPGGFVNAGKYYYGTKAANTPAGDSQTAVKLKCPRGTQVVAGGGGGFSNQVGEQMINFNGPFDSGDRNKKPEDGWVLFEDNFGLEGNERFGVDAICVKKH
jgi:hypothetical protein